LGHSRRFRDIRIPSALPSIADIARHGANGRNGADFVEKVERQSLQEIRLTYNKIFDLIC